MANIEQNEDLQQDQLENVENSLGKTEMFIEENRDKFLMGIGIVVLIIFGVWGYLKFIKAPKETNAAEQMFQAEQYLQRDSVNLALNGDNNYPGFLTIIDKYSGTKAANNAKYYAGVCYMKLGQFDEAIKMLDGFSSSDPNLEPIAIGLAGDAYMENGDVAKAESNYKKAADKAKENDFVAPIYLQKLAVAYEKQQKFNEALAAYENIKDNYPSSSEARNAEKNIQAMKIKLGK